MTRTTRRPIHAMPARARALTFTGAVFFAGYASAIAAPNAAAEGKVLFDRACGRCHQIGLGATNSEGPELNGIVGAPAGAVPGYNYSPANKQSAIIWSDQSFNTFIENPKADMPGTRMAIPGVTSAAERAAILAYVRRYKPDGTTQ